MKEHKIICAIILFIILFVKNKEKYKYNKNEDIYIQKDIYKKSDSKRYALQIYGEFRSYRKCLPDILSFINYNNKNYDIFILTQNNCSIEDLNRVINYFPNSNIVLKFFENYPDNIKNKEDELNKKNIELIDSIAINNKWQRWHRNWFVSRLWYRRHLCNQIRLNYEKENNVQYETVVRTRFDIGFLGNKTYLDYENLPFINNDLITVGKPEIINLESQLNWFPFTPKFFYNCLFFDNEKVKEYEKKTNSVIPDYAFNSSWLYGSECNLFLYLNYHHIKNYQYHNFSIIVKNKKGKYVSKY
jgi:hypothetical protein